MWEFAVDFVVTAIEAAFTWFSSILDAFPGAWSTIYTLIIIMIVSRFLLGPIVGAAFGSVGSSDKAQKKER